MPSLENIQLKLHAFEIEKSGKLIYLHCGDETLTLPEKWEKYVEALKQSQSIKESILFLKDNNHQIRFKALAKVLEGLCRCRILVNHQEVLEALRNYLPQYSWQYSWVRKPLVRTSTHGSFQSNFNSVALPIMLLLGLGFLVAPHVLSLFQISGPFAHIGIFDLLVLYLVNSILLCSKGFFKSFLFFCIQGVFPGRRLTATPVGIDFEVLSESSFSGESRWLIGTFMSAFLLIYPGLAALFLLNLSISVEKLETLKLILILIIFLEFSPFSRSEFISILKLFFNNKKDNWRELIEKIHPISLILWPVAFLLVFLKGKEVFFSFSVISVVIGIIVISIFLEVFKFIDQYNHLFDIQDLFGAKKEKEQFISSQGDSVSRGEVIGKVSFFKNLSPEVRQNMIRQSRLINVRKGMRVCQQGYRDRKMYVIVEGRMGVLKKGGFRPNQLIPLSEGSLFGEVTFFKGTPRTADVVALKDSQLLEIRFDLKNFNPQLDEKQFLPLQQRIWLNQSLVSSGVFSSLPIDAINLIVEAGDVKHYTVGDVVIQQGDFGHECFFVIQGECDVHIDNIFVRKMKRGQFFGEIALLRKVLRTATVTAVSPLMLLSVRDNQFWDLLSSNLGLAQLVEETAVSRIEN